MKKILIVACLCIFALGACSGGSGSDSSKPSKETISNKIQDAIKAYADEEPSSDDEERLKDLADCIVDGIYDELTVSQANELVKGLADGAKSGDSLDDLGIPDDTYELVDNQGDECYEELS